MKQFLYAFIFFAICSVSFSSANGQKLSDSELQTFLAKATEKTSEYSAVFKNLTAAETKTFEIFNETGNLINREKILSDIIIYEPENNIGIVKIFSSPDL